MALQVWLPLIKDLTNYGLANVTVTSNAVTQSTTESKLGASYSFNGTTTWIKTTMPSTMKSLKNSSVCMWIKSTASVGAGGGIMHNDSNAYACMCLYTSGWQMATGSAWKYISTGTFVNTSVWHHVACTMDDTKIRTYLDGVLVTETTIAAQGVLTDITNKNFIGLGCDFPGGDEYFTGFINDFRVYDHCLSKREIKEISKGLVCHYLLNNNGIGNPNLVTGTSYNEVQYTYPSEGFVDRWTATTPAVPSASQYTLSFFAKSTVNGDQIRAHWYNPNTTTRCESSQGTVTTSGDGCINITLSTEWKFYWIVYTQSETTAVKHLILPRMGRSDIAPGTGTVFIKCVKLEEGNKATPWIPHTTDAQYAVFAQGNNIEYDCSGYKYDASIVGTLECTSDAPRNSSAVIFANDKYIRRSSMPAVAGYTNSYTFSWWGKYSSTASKMMWGYQNGNRLNLYLNSSKFFWNTGDGNNNPFGSISSDEYLNKWHHFAVTGDGTTTKLYIDGVFKANATTYKAITGTDLIFNGWNTGNDYNFNGSLSDFRLYSTALSATDILELYNAPINFNKHSVMTQGEFVEQ